MTTIHVTINDHAEALGVVATLLNQGYQVSIDMDIVPDRVEPDYMSSELQALVARVERDTKRAKADPKHRPFIDARKVQAEPLVAYGAKVGFDGNDYFIDGMKVSEAEFSREMRMRAQARNERRLEAAKAIEAVGCDACGAKTHEVCRSASGKGYGDSFVHIDRIRAFHTLNEAVPVRE